MFCEIIVFPRPPGATRMTLRFASTNSGTRSDSTRGRTGTTRSHTRGIVGKYGWQLRREVPCALPLVEDVGDGLRRECATLVRVGDRGVDLACAVLVEEAEEARRRPAEMGHRGS